MECKNCGAQMEDTAKFCGICGTPLALVADTAANKVTNSVNDGVDLSGASRGSAYTFNANRAADVITAAHVRANMASDEYRKAQGVVEELEYAYYEKSNLLKSMNIAGIVCGALALMGPLNTVSIAATDGLSSALSVFFISLISFLVIMVWVWGIFAVKNFFAVHGWTFFGSLTVLLVAISMILVVAWFMGVPYYFSTKSKVKKLEAALETARETLNEKESVLHAMAAL